MSRILIAAESSELCHPLIAFLRESGHDAQWTRSGEAALRAARSGGGPDLVVLDLRLGGVVGMDALDTLRRLRAQHGTMPVLVLSPGTDLKPTIQAMKLGATDACADPIDPSTVLEHVHRLLDARGAGPVEAWAMVGGSPAFRRALDVARRFAVPDINVLLLGETGTGKELFARTIHADSPRRDGPFVPVDCSTLAETLIESELFGHEKGSFTGATTSRMGRFELAQRGTLFLDEIGNLPLAIQAKLLRVLQTRQLERVGGRQAVNLDVRVVAATNVNLAEAIAAGRFRQDLYFRLEEIVIRLPPLREREGDVESLATHFVEVHSERFGLAVRGIAPAALEVLQGYSWPGNVRELENAIKAAVVMAEDLVLPEHLPTHISAAAGGPVVASEAPESAGELDRLRFEVDVGLEGDEVDLKALGARAAEQAERSLLQALVRRGLRSSAHLARLLAVDPKTLRQKLRRYGIEPPGDARRLNVAVAAGPDVKTRG